MAIRSGFFNSVNGDRKYDARRFAEYFATLIGNGVFPNPSSNLQIIANNDMTVTVRPGKAWINGYILINDDDYILNIEPADGALSRMDRIVARYDTVDREIRLEVKKGTFASSPVAPELQRGADAYELALTDIHVNNGSISITQANITDTRLNTELCGVVHGTVDQVDTTTLFNQYLTWLDEKKNQDDTDMLDWTSQKQLEYENWKAQQESNMDNWQTQEQSDFNNWRNQEEQNFNAWFASIEDILDENIATTILNMIGDLETLTTTDKSSLVNAINEVDAKEVDLTPIENQIDDLENEVTSHRANYASFKNNIEAIRYVDEKMELKINGEWVEFKGKDGYPVGNVAGLSISVGNSEATIKWQDPDDVTIKDSLNNIITIARWKGTKLVRKAGSYPINEADGDLVLDNATRNKYQTNGYKDTGLTNGTTYYYMLFPYTEENVVTIDSANRISATPQAYDDLTGSPGAKNLISGTMEEGFFGEVSTTALITGDALASQVGISQGTSQHSTAGWLKFAYKGKIQFIAKKPIRNSISWDAINTAKCVYGDSGDKTVVIDGKTYKVTLMRALEPTNDPKTVASANSGEVNHGSEWNRLMCQIHEEAINGSWEYPDNIESDIGILEHSLGSGSQGMYDDADLVVKSGDGRVSWCQEMGTSTSGRLVRGSDGVSNSYNGTSSDAGSYYGWRPVLELVP